MALETSQNMHDDNICNVYKNQVHQKQYHVKKNILSHNVFSHIWVRLGLRGLLNRFKGLLMLHLTENK